MSSTGLLDSSSTEDPIGAALDTEIAALEAQIKALKSMRSLQTSAILSSRSTQKTLQRLRASSQNTSKQSSRAKSSLPDTNDVTPLLAASTTQTNHNTQNLYRACGSITSFRIRDPDPNAVDNGDVLGLRIDVSSRGRFGKSYHVMLNKPFGEGSGHDGDGDGGRKDLLRIHRHTVPPCIPLASLARRFLPYGKGTTTTVEGAGPEAESGDGRRTQNLQKFARALRREIVAYHNRIATIKTLRQEFALDEKGPQKGGERVIADISAADAEARQIKIEWVDGRIGRVLVSEKGDVLRCVIIGEGGRDRDTERRIVGERWKQRIDGIGARLREGIY